MPDEILAEILLSAHPGDLLSLSQTCKLFRNTLMKESAANIWKSAERNVPHLPVYPWSDMAPHAYAALLFSKFCTSYGMPTLTEPDPYLLVRFCSSCREVKLAEISKIEIPNCSTNLLLQRIGFDLLPGRSDDLVAQDLENISLLRVSCDAALRRWKEEQQQEVQLRNQFALRLQKFMREVNSDRARESGIKVKERRTEILRRLRELGWKDDEFNMGYSKESSQDEKGFTYYPYLASTFGSWYWSGDELLTTTVSSYHRHELAETVSKALLREIDMVDISYLELAVMGGVFVCRRCRMRKAKDWKGVVQHYIEELRSWDVPLLANPRFYDEHND
ncbi:unnamed protein product [Rhizoctonia solani]|nr:unnamed protein product [Rhizoctonia solani]